MPLGLCWLLVVRQLCTDVVTYPLLELWRNREIEILKEIDVHARCDIGRARTGVQIQYELPLFKAYFVAAVEPLSQTHFAAFIVPLLATFIMALFAAFQVTKLLPRFVAGFVSRCVAGSP
ncbi:hypothetical protein ASE33_28760 [Pseudomonas sp. Root9]|nr:hypothetical protein ASE33_28760 [Pseudomonas sp. Root9]